VSLGAVKPTKTEERRTVDLTPRLVGALGDWQAAIEADALAPGGSSLTPGCSRLTAASRST
jgi:hypothetical protein